MLCFVNHLQVCCRRGTTLTILVYRHLRMGVRLRAHGFVLHLFPFLVTWLVCSWGEDRDIGRYFWSVRPTADEQLSSLTPGRSFHLNSHVFSWMGHRAFGLRKIPFSPFPVRTRGSMEPPVWEPLSVTKPVRVFLSSQEGLFCRCPQHTRSQTLPEECSPGLPVWAGRSSLTPARRPP